VGNQVFVAIALTLVAASPAEATLVYNKGSDTSKATVWSAADDGSGGKRLASGLGPRISPDGTTVAYQSIYGAPGTRPQLLTVPSAGGKRSILLDPQWSPETQAWSPDSKTIAAVTGRELGAKRLVLIDVATAKRRTVASGQFHGVSFSPAGDAIVYSRAARDGYRPPADLFVAPVAGGAKPTRLTRSRSDVFPVWGPQSIVFARQRTPKRRGDTIKQDLFLISPAGGPVKRLTKQTPSYLLTGPSPLAWSADGARLLANFGGQDTNYAQTVNPVSGRARTVGRLRDQIIGAALSRDGSTILASRGSYEAVADLDVVTIPYGGGGTRVLVRRAFSPDWNR
jgi:Tol biopolymer transport system component